MWIKCSEKLPNENGLYLIAERFNGHGGIYRIARFMRNLGDVIGLEDHDGECGFYESDPEWGSYKVEPEVWQPIEKYDI